MNAIKDGLSLAAALSEGMCRNPSYSGPCFPLYLTSGLIQYVCFGFKQGLTNACSTYKVDLQDPEKTHSVLDTYQREVIERGVAAVRLSRNATKENQKGDTSTYLTLDGTIQQVSSQLFVVLSEEIRIVREEY